MKDEREVKLEELPNYAYIGSDYGCLVYWGF